MQSILVKDYMDHNPHAIPDSANVKEAVESMLRDNIIGAPVVDADRKLVGYVSEQDCIKDILNNTFFCDEPPSVKTVMSTEVLSVSPDTSIVEVASSMVAHRPKNYPVIQDGKLVGLINRAHVLRALLENDKDCYRR